MAGLAGENASGEVVPYESSTSEFEVRKMLAFLEYAKSEAQRLQQRLQDSGVATRDNLQASFAILKRQANS